ncbi:MAG: SGNH/GDSL hydrolase family protein [Candidatus Woesearchaeota archaeon]|nr:SGNH/GDSL hydrolase family protein [Candidatus Woesearchaeota archaeon]
MKKMKTKSKKQKIALLLLFNLIFIVFALEALIRITKIDLELVKPTLYLHNNDRTVYMHSNNSGRLYELIPNVSIIINRSVEGRSCYVAEGDEYPVINVSINSLGFRGPEMKAEKSQGKIRIFVFGASNTFGFCASNNETYPAYMQYILDERYPEKFEVWNAGLNAYVMSQEAAYAEEVIKKYRPDIIIFQITNRGRRPFLMDDEQFKENFINKELYDENFPIISEKKIQSNFERFLARNSGIYRSIIATYNNLFVQRKIKNMSDYYLIDNINYKYFSSGAAVYNVRNFYNIIENNDNLSFVLIGIPLKNCEKSTEYCNIPKAADYINHYFAYCDYKEEKSNLAKICIEFVNKSEEYYLVHPPAYVYKEYAEAIVNSLEKRGLIN